MPKSAFSENRTEATRAFVEHLRRNPAEARRDPTELASRFGLDVEFVRRALGRLPTAAKPSAAPRSTTFAVRAEGFVAVLDEALEKAAANPLRFEAFSLVGLVAVLIALNQLMPNRALGAFGIRGALQSFLILATIAVQMAVFYRRRMVRYALLGGLLFGVGTAVPLMASVWVGLQRGAFEAPPTDEVSQGLIVFSTGFAMLFVGLLYAGAASLISLFGGWVQMRRQDEEWERLSRQELLERYFELQKRLEHSTATPETPQKWEAWPVVRKVRRHPLLAGVVVGVGAGLVQIVVDYAFGFRGGMVPNNDAHNLLSVVHALDTYTVFGIVAFLAGGTARGALSGLFFALGAYAISLIPVGSFGLSHALEPGRLMATAFAVVLGAVAGLGSTIQRRAVREGRLQRNDGATLVAEMLEIQWRLEEDATSVTVLVVDAAKSTAMKVGADPLDVEYSFREYQMWIAEVCAGYGGRIHSVAGDGAVIAFTDAGTALAASRRLQTDVVRFNATSNRLPKPFRLRLGLHAGRVAGDLNDVQFTEVIDIAAHVEEIAPVGGIAATVAVIDQLGEEGFLPLSRDVDGQGVYIALVPTEA